MTHYKNYSRLDLMNETFISVLHSQCAYPYYHDPKNVNYLGFENDKSYI